MSGALMEPAAKGGSAKKWWIAAVAMALVAGLGVGLGVGLGMRPQHAGGSGAARGVPHRELLRKVSRSRPSIVFVGDGLTESGFSYTLGGWGSKLVGAYQRKADLINRGFGGYYTKYFNDYMLGSLFDVTNPIMGVLFLGVKDSMIKAASGKIFTPPDKFREYVDAIMQDGEAAGIRYWLIITPPPVWELPGKPGARTMANTQLYADALWDLGKKYNATVLDIFANWQRVPDWTTQFINADRLHLSAGGNEKLFNDVLNTIKAQIPDMDPAKMAWQFPSMDDIDRDNPGPAFANLGQ
ncbi:MAG: SGNH hydrolase-type esterase domain-containing protein [Monoraphidium minutum]|nr:MAG: SGNH hydrolase-type esterase domain-containing protein [Monoraphidium minutum]